MLSGMLIHWQNSCASCSQQCTGRHEVQSCATSQQSKNLPCVCKHKEILGNEKVMGVEVIPHEKNQNQIRI
jgi:hypothetical protein